MTKHRSHKATFKRQVAQEFIAGETLHGLSKRHDVSRQLIRIWVSKYEAGALDEDAQAADMLTGGRAWKRFDTLPSTPVPLVGGGEHEPWWDQRGQAPQLSRRKSAIVLKSGFKPRTSQMTSILRWASRSSRRLDRTRLR
jgi:Transposase